MSPGNDLLEERIKDEKIKVVEAQEELDRVEDELIEAAMKVKFFKSNLKERERNLKILLKRRRSNG